MPIVRAALNSRWRGSEVRTGTGETVTGVAELKSYTQ